MDSAMERQTYGYTDEGKRIPMNQPAYASNKKPKHHTIKKKLTCFVLLGLVICSTVFLIKPLQE